MSLVLVLMSMIACICGLPAREQILLGAQKRSLEHLMLIMIVSFAQFITLVTLVILLLFGNVALINRIRQQ